MRTLRLTFMALFLVAVSAAHARQQAVTEGQAEYVLDKLSQRLRSRPAPRADIRKIYESADLDAYLRERARAYLSTPEFAETLSYHLDELFFIKAPLVSDRLLNKIEPKAYSESEAERFKRNNALSNLFRSLARENRSWDELLVSKSYAAYDGSLVSGIDASDLGFYSAVADVLSPISGLVRVLSDATGQPDANGYPMRSPTRSVVKLDFGPSDPRIAGALTTSRFFNRYTNTAINKNRRRAAAVLRIFLGKDMVPAIGTGESIDHELNKLAYGQGFEVSATEVTERLRDPHGKNPACYKCHQMLDPMGRVFASSGSILGSEPSPGALVLPERKLIQNVEGVGQLADYIRRQPEYVETQVRALWEWFVGKDIPLFRPRLKQMTELFEKAGRRSQDFIAALVSQPEFRSPELFLNKPGELESIEARAIFNTNCASCHTGDAAGTQAPAVSFDPLRIDDQDAAASAQEVYRQVVRLRRMPKGHKLSDDQVELVRKWLATGAIDGDGKMQITPGSVQ